MTASRSVSAGELVVRIVQWLHDERQPDALVVMPSGLVDRLKTYVETGRPDPEIQMGLETALRECPLWAHLSVSDLTWQQRRTVAGRFALAVGRPVEVDESFEIMLH